MNNCKLTSEWKVLKFEECITQLNTGLNPRNNFKLGTGKLKYITAKNLTKYGTIDFSKCEYIDEVAKQIINKRSDIKIGDVLLSSRAPIGQCHLIKENPDFYDIGESIFSIRANKSIILPEYLCLYLSSDFFVKVASKNTTGSIIKEIRIGDLMKINVVVPPMSIQKKIADCLNALDGKIANNNAISAQLESLANTIYNYWFLQFEFPNEEGKPYKSSGGKMVWNEELKREIPEGWKVSTIRKYVSRITNGLNPRKNFILGSGSNYYVTTKNLDNKGNIDFSTCDYISDDALDKINNRSDLKIGDVLFSGIATVGRVYLITEKPVNWNINEAIFTLRPAKGVSSYFLYNFCQSEEIQKQADLNAIGSSQRCLTQDHFLDIPCLYIPNNIQMKFEQKVKPIIDMRKMTENETQQLTSLRDFLLPLLMNGQVTFKDDVASEEE